MKDDSPCQEHLRNRKRLTFDDSNTMPARTLTIVMILYVGCKDPCV